MRASGGPSSAKFDRAALLAAVDNDEDLLGGLIEMFLQEYPNWLGDIAEGLKAGSDQAVRRAAHTIRGAASQFLIQAVVDEAQSVEIAAANGDLDRASEAYNRLKQELELCKPELADMVERAAAALT